MATSEIKVTSATLRNKKETLKGHNDKLKNMVNELVSIHRNLDSQWDGPANDQFRTNFNQDKRLFDAFTSLIDQYITNLNNDIELYETKEAANKNIAATRSKK